MSHKHSVRQILLLLIAVLLASAVIVRVLQSTNNLRYLWISMATLVLGYMCTCKRGPVDTLLLWLVYVKAAVLVLSRAAVEGMLVIRRDWDVCLWRAKQLP